MKISVVTPSFRQLDLLKLCVASVADQQGDFDVEHLIQDGGSGPDFEAWAAEHAPAGWISEKDGGMYDAINRGFQRAKGDIVAWLNCDEQYLPGALEAVARIFRENPATDLVFGDVVVVDASGVPESYRMALVPKRGHIRHCTLATFSAATFVRRKVIDRGILLDARWRTIADAVWIDRMLGEGLRATVIRRPLAAFKRTGENLGQTEMAAQELQEWRRETGSASPLARQAWAMSHRLRKWSAGAYRQRPVEVEIYEPEIEGRRRTGAQVNERWRAET